MELTQAPTNANILTSDDDTIGRLLFVDCIAPAIALIVLALLLYGFSRQ